MRIDGTAGNDNRTGTAGDDVFYMRKGDDVASGWGGDDVLNGGDGDDTLSGGDGADVLFGDAGNDELRGGTGADRLVGGGGNDRLIGGPGADTFLYYSVKANTDTIMDFEVGVDTIDLRNIDANWSRDGDQPFRYIGGRAFSGEPGEVRHFVADLGDGYATFIMVNTAGDWQPELTIGLVGAKYMSAGDFAL